MMEQMERIGMAQAVSPLEGNIESALSGPRLKCFRHCGRLQGATRCSKAKEDLSVLAITGNSLEIIIESRTHLVGER
jgi:hypothetical protein